MADQKEPKKETVRITLPPRPAGDAAAPSSTGRDTVRINLPARPPANGTVPRPPGTAGTPGARPPMAQTPLPPAPSKAVAPPPVFRKPPVPPSSATSAAPGAALPKPTLPSPPVATNSGLASAAGPKKETARISVLPDPPIRPAHTVEMKKTQPLITMPEPATQTAAIPVNVLPEVAGGFVDELPMVFCWAVLGASLVILTIQIWNYVS